MSTGAGAALGSAAGASGAALGSAALDGLVDSFDNSLLRELRPEREPSTAPSTQSRAVRSGHFVRVETEALPDPELVAVSPSMCAELGLQASEVERDSSLFAAALSGAPSEETGVSFDAWATAYAVSVGGHNSTNSPFGPWGYGDGRAMSIGEAVHGGQRWELQLKGGGRTPFARQFDGKAVLRSSVRELLASECMHALGVPTTRALSLVASASQRVPRAWYPPPRGEPRSPHPPSKLVEERTAVLCRCAPSFLRVGHVELFALRGDKAEMEELLMHAVRREYPHLLEEHAELPDILVALFAEFVQRQAELVAGWLRVGYVQGNMNSDNCLLGGRTLDYGPFGFMEAYDPQYQPFTSDAMGGYAFSRQPHAAHTNCATLAQALVTALPEEQRERWSAELTRILNEDYPEHFRRAHQDGCRRKLGLSTWRTETGELWAKLLQLMQTSEADFTVLFRLLAVEDFPQGAGSLAPAFREGMAPTGAALAEWGEWINSLQSCWAAEGRGAEERVAEMKAASPKYVPRNWMLYEAYDAAERGDYEPVRSMLAALLRPYDEQPALEEAFFRATPPWAQSAGGLSFMS